MYNEYWLNVLKDIYSFNNFLNDNNHSKIFDKVDFDFSKDYEDLENFLSENNVSFLNFIQVLYHCIYQEPVVVKVLFSLTVICILMILFLRLNMMIIFLFFDFIILLKM